MTPETLIRMANQIADFFKSQGEAYAVAGAEDHILKFWDPRMRAQLITHLDAGGVGLKPIARAAAEKIRARQTAV